MAPEAGWTRSASGAIVTPLRRSVEGSAVHLEALAMHHPRHGRRTLDSRSAPLPAGAGTRLLCISAHPASGAELQLRERPGADDVLAGALERVAAEWRFDPAVPPAVERWSLLEAGDPSAVFLRGLSDHCVYIERVLRDEPSLGESPYFARLGARSRRTLEELDREDAPWRWLHRLAEDRLDLELPAPAGELWRRATARLAAASTAGPAQEWKLGRWIAEVAEQERLFLVATIGDQFLAQQAQPALLGTLDEDAPHEVLQSAAGPLGSAPGQGPEVRIDGRETAWLLVEALSAIGAQAAPPGDLRMRGDREADIALRPVRGRPGRWIGSVDLAPGRYRWSAAWAPQAGARIWVYTLEKHRT